MDDDNNGNISQIAPLQEIDPLGEVCLHLVDTVQEKLPGALKRFRVAFFGNPMGVPMPGLSPPLYQWIFTFLLTLESSIGTLKKHLELSAMDRLRACQTIYSLFHAYRGNITLFAETKMTKKDLIASLEEAFEIGVVAIRESFKSIKEAVEEDDVGLWHDLTDGMRAFYDVAEMLGGDEVFMPKPDPQKVAQLAGLFTPTPGSNRVNLNLPKVCTIHPPNNLPHQQGGSVNIIMKEDVEINITDLYFHKLPPFDNIMKERPIFVQPTAEQLAEREAAIQKILADQNSWTAREKKRMEEEGEGYSDAYVLF